MAEDQNGEVSTQGECTDCTTQERSFDALARGVANGSISRRRALRLLGSALLGGAVASIPGVGWLAGDSGEARAAPGDAPGGSDCGNSGQSCTAQKCCQGLSCLTDPTNSTEKFCCPLESKLVCGSKCCPAGALLGCTAGKCQCPPGEVECPNLNNLTGTGKCVNLLEDPDNCGGCGLSDPKFKCPAPTGKDAPCRVRACVNGTCTTRPNTSADGTPCNADDNKCTENDSCLAGLCTPGTLKTCPVSDNPCVLRTVCDPTTGQCVEEPALEGTPCRDAQGECDLPSFCTGTSTTCPPNEFKANTVVCRPAAGDCDVAETCTGNSAACPEDKFKANTVVCRPAAGDCDVAETCTGNSAACPEDKFKANTVVCRPAAGDCDVEEKCTGLSAACPPDLFKAATVVCRPTAGPCDEAETCTGLSAACPEDKFLPVTSVCRPAAGPCDLPEFCTGLSAACPEDRFAPALTVCRATAGPCDVAENCTGTSAACPEDKFKPATEVCRPAADAECDVAENCTGTSAACPPNQFKAEGTPCNHDNNLCTEETCQQGVCKSTGNQVQCPPSTEQCKVNVCVPATGICQVQDAPAGTPCCQGGTPIFGCVTCTTNADCGSGQTCTGGQCTCTQQNRRPCGKLCCPPNMPGCTPNSQGNPTCS